MANSPQCRSKGYGKPVLAIYTPSRYMTNGLGNRSDEKLSTLEVTPAGKKNLDQVLLSLLAIERRALTPGKNGDAIVELFSN